ncbi:CGNR zinc finger domain-containing protein [Streptomyces sp. NPDC058291]|uniref:CGNR zinc finger domain-containing protein n=1 Tax=Streptomyces sp. NPDC058291 TaxID=3346427 RepID=UPI0036E156FA
MDELRFDAGRICLDLMATAHPCERLDGVRALCAWIHGCGLVPPGAPLTLADAAWPGAFRELRRDVGRLVHGWLAQGGCGPVGGMGPYDGALARVNDAARAVPLVPRAVRGEDGSLVRALDRPAGCAALLATVARDTVELLTDPVARAGLRQCAGDDCPLVYVDMSRGRRRRWCSSEVCGNRERVARHRRRTALARS